MPSGLNIYYHPNRQQMLLNSIVISSSSENIVALTSLAVHYQPAAKVFRAVASTELHYGLQCPTISIEIDQLIPQEERFSPFG